MAEDNRAVIERMKAEGLLVRDSGTNSIKSVKNILSENNVEMVDTINSLVMGISAQSEILKDMLSIQKDVFQIQVEKIRDDARNEKLKKPQRQPREKPSNPLLPGKTGDKSSISDKFSFGFFQDFFGSLLAGTLLALGASAALRTAGVAIASRLVKGGLLIALAPFVADIVDTLLTSAFESIGSEEILDSEAKEQFKNSLGNAISFGLIGGLISRKLVPMFAIGGAIYGPIEEFITNSENKIVEDLKNQFGPEAVAALSSIVLSGLGFVGLKAAFKKALNQDTKENGEKRKKRFARTLVGRIGIASLIGSVALAIGDEILGTVDENGESKVIADEISTVANAALIGSFLGPKGALIGAIVGLATAGIRSLTNWLEEQNKKVIADTISDSKDALGDATQSIASGNYTQAAEELAIAEARIRREMERNEQLLGGGVMNEELQQQLKEIQQTLSQLPIMEMTDPGKINVAALQILRGSDLDEEDYRDYVDAMVRANSLDDPEAGPEEIVGKILPPDFLSERFRGDPVRFREENNEFWQAIDDFNITSFLPITQPARDRYLELSNDLEGLRFDVFGIRRRNIQADLNRMIEIYGEGIRKITSAPVVVQGGTTVNDSKSIDNSTTTYINNRNADRVLDQAIP